MDIKTPPDDAAKTASGLIYKVLTANPAGPQPTRSDATLVNYTGWRQRTGETFFTTKGSGRPITLDLVHSAPAFAEALQLLHAGERMVLWVPPTATAPEVLVYEIELTQIVKPQVARQSPKPEQAAPKADVGTATAATTEAAAAKPLQR